MTNFDWWVCDGQDNWCSADHIRIVFGALGEERREEVCRDPMPRGAQHQQSHPADQAIHHPATPLAVNGECLTMDKIGKSCSAIFNLI